MFSCGVVQLANAGPETENAIRNANKSSLRRYLRSSSEQIANLRALLGANEPNETYSALRHEATKNSWKYVILSRWRLDELFVQLSDLVEGWSRLPAHTLLHIYLDPHRSQETALMWLEENAYSDMAVAWNRALESHSEAELEIQSGPRGPKNRDHVAMVRLAI
jgi:hypothetical protein